VVSRQQPFFPPLPLHRAHASHGGRAHGDSSLGQVPDLSVPRVLQHPHGEWLESVPFSWGGSLDMAHGAGSWGQGLVVRVMPGPENAHVINDRVPPVCIKCGAFANAFSLM
jgi:hypothetical protein